jgi:hypothetical protein
MNRTFHICAVHGLYFYGRRRFRGSAFGWARAVTDPGTISLPMPGPGNGPAPAGRTRRSRNDAHSHHGDRSQLEIDRRLLRHLGHSRFRVSLGLHGVLAFADTDSILTRSNRLGNSDYPAERLG